MYFKNSSF